MWDKFKKKLDLPESYISITLGLLVVLVAGILTYNYFVKNQVQKTEEETAIVEQQNKAQEKPELPAKYTVKEGDTLWSIALNHYNSGYNWVSISQANNMGNPDYVVVGQELTVPEAEVIKPEGDVMATTAPPKEYTVVTGDNLWSIAEREYATGFSWTKIAQENNLENPGIIHPGNVLRLPR